MARLFLTIVGMAYLSLAFWCSIDPAQTSRAVGFSLQPGSGDSEFLVIYGGLEFGLGLIFLWPLYRRDELLFSLRVCLIVHGCLAVFRTASFVLFTGIGKTTCGLAATEWTIFALSLAAWRFHGQQAFDSEQEPGPPRPPS